MSRMDGLRQTETPFDRFLYAEIGQDNAGNAVSVLSAFARLGLDPWAEAAGLSALPQEGARQRLGLLLVRFYDVPALGSDRDTIIPRLVDMLPRAHGRRPSTGPSLPADSGALGPRPIVFALMVLLFLAQAVILGLGATGN